MMTNIEIIQQISKIMNSFGPIEEKINRIEKFFIKNKLLFTKLDLFYLNKDYMRSIKVNYLILKDNKITDLYLYQDDDDIFGFEDTTFNDIKEYFSLEKRNDNFYMREILNLIWEK